MKIFFGVLVFFLAFGWLVLLFSTIGLFYTGTVVLSILASAVVGYFSFLSSRAKSRDLRPLTNSKPPNTHADSSTPPPLASGGVGRNDKTNKLFFLVLAISLFVSFTTCYYATPTVFGGRDQGSIATAAIYLSENHNLKVDSPIVRNLFQKYGPGRALNFPGFDYTKNGDLISRFPLGYTSYLASAYDFFGLKGIQYANFVPLFLFFMIFWLLLKEFFSNKVSFLGFLLAASFFPFQWFAKYALTETYTLFLVWAGIYFLLKFCFQGSTLKIEKAEPFYAWISLAFFALSALTRIEGLVFFLPAIIYIYILNRKKIIPLPENFHKYLIISALFLLCLYTYLNFPALTDSAKNLAKAFLPGSAKESAPSSGLYAHLARVFFNYNIITYLILGLAGIVWLAAKLKKSWIKPEFLPILITFPAFFYLLAPQITLDDPWLLRRFVFAVFPVLIFYSIYFLNRFFYHKIFLYIAIVVLIAANSVVSWRFFTLSENKDLLPQIEKISQKFGPNDLILVDRLATGSGFSLPSEPLWTIYGKQAVYFFNADDLKYIDQAHYENIYLLSSLEEENPWYAELVKGKSPQSLDVIQNNFLEPSDKKFGLAVNIEAQTLVGIWKLK